MHPHARKRERERERATANSQTEFRFELFAIDLWRWFKNELVEVKINISSRSMHGVFSGLQEHGTKHGCSGLYIYTL